MESTEKTKRVILNEIHHCMARVMDDCEFELGDSPRWKFLRSRLLKTFGERGLAGKIIEILEPQKINEATNER